MKKSVFIIFLLFSIISLQNLGAQEVALSDSLALLRQELRTLQQKYDRELLKFDSLIIQLEAKIKTREQEDDLQKLLEEANQLAAREKEDEMDLSKKFHTGVRQQQGLNPNVSLGGDFFGAFSSSDHEFITEPGDFSYGNNGFFLREVELALVAPLDPFTRGKNFISITEEGISIEEAYMEWLNLPLKMNLKIGIFYAEFGPLNRYHDHALPQFDRPRALVNVFSNAGLGGVGIAANFMLPRILFSDASMFDLSILNGGNDVSFNSDPHAGLLYIGQFKNYYDISENSYFEFRLSGVTGKNPAPGDYRSYVGSLGLSYKWVPVGRAKYRTFDWKTEFLYSFREEVSGTTRSMGFYSSIQNKLGARFWIGGRIGYSELPEDHRQQEWDYTINLDFWQSEFVFTRIQYQYNWRNIISFETFPVGLLPNNHAVLIQVCWAMGPHKHEAY